MEWSVRNKMEFNIKQREKKKVPFAKKRIIMQNETTMNKINQEEIQCENFSVKVCIVCYKCRLLLLLLSSLNGWCVFRSGSFFVVASFVLLLFCCCCCCCFGPFCLDHLQWNVYRKKYWFLRVCFFVCVRENDSFFFAPSSFTQYIRCCGLTLQMHLECVLYFCVCDKLLIDFIAFLQGLCHYSSNKSKQHSIWITFIKRDKKKKKKTKMWPFSSLSILMFGIFTSYFFFSFSSCRFFTFLFESFSLKL